MATIVTVHGTFAAPTAPDANGVMPTERQWWEVPSVFDEEMRGLVGGHQGPVEIKPFTWPGNNSETERRDAAERLAQEFRDLDARGEPFCVVGHSHGGSIVASALLDNAARKRPLPNLKRWITVGTPFINLRKEQWLLTRLSLIRKVIFVASMMLLLMFLVYLLATEISGDRLLFGGTFPRILAVTGLMTSLPAVVLYFVLLYADSRGLLAYHTRITRRASDAFSSRWLSLAHPDDEAIQGLSLLPDAQLTFFDKSFAVSAVTLISVITLPILYFAILFSPPAMVGLAEWMKSEFYSQTAPEAEAALKALRSELIAARRSEGEAVAPNQGVPLAQPIEDRRAAWAAYREKHKALEAQYPDLDAIERGIRFRQRFYEKNGQPCEGGTLCGGGRDIATNSGLLLHLVTDEVSWALGAADLGGGRQRMFWNLIVPAVIVPVALGILALLLMVFIKALASVLSTASSNVLNRITNAEVKRAAFGNDTEGEVAIGAADRPSWLPTSQPRLPAEVADLVTAYSNAAASKSIAKFRHAIGQIRFAEPKHSADTAISTYFTWKELVHASYFDVPEFRKLIAQAVSRAEGFAASRKFEADPDYARTAGWLSTLETAPQSAAPVAGGSPEKDSKAVSAVVAATVKADP